MSPEAQEMRRAQVSISATTVTSSAAAVAQRQHRRGTHPPHGEWASASEDS